MTNKTFFETIINANLSEEVTAKAEAMLAQLTKERESAKSRVNSKRAEANRPIVESILAFLGDGQAKLTSEIAKACEVSTSKASSLLVSLENQNLVMSSDVKVKGQGVRKAWSLVSP
jgi:predicted transcriptional regulator